MLSGGLDPANVGRAIALTGAAIVDVSSGVERARGVKDEQLIRNFIEAVRRASQTARKSAFGRDNAGQRTQFLQDGPRRAWPFRPVWRSLRGRDPDALILELEQAYQAARADPGFEAELSSFLEHYVGDPRRSISPSG